MSGQNIITILLTTAPKMHSTHDNNLPIVQTKPITQLNNFRQLMKQKEGKLSKNRLAVNTPERFCR